jgi:hypothetical protein
MPTIRDIEQHFGVTFTPIPDLRPQRDSEGFIQIYTRQNEYTHRKGAELNEYGLGPFCKLDMESNADRNGPTIIPETKALFILADQQQNVQYIGTCGNLRRRIQNQIGNISPSDCFAEGQSTNCRLNTWLLHQFIADRTITLLFCSNAQIKKKSITDYYDIPLNKKATHGK